MNNIYLANIIYNNELDTYKINIKFTDNNIYVIIPRYDLRKEGYNVLKSRAKTFSKLARLENLPIQTEAVYFQILIDCICRQL